MANFAIIGVAGYVAPRHIKAIKDTGNVLVAALDPNDSVGIIDKYFYDVDFFTEVERFDRHLYKLRDTSRRIDYISICSPNYLHDAHIRLALRSGANAICEKPLVLNPWNIKYLKRLEEETNNKINTILQLRLQPDIIKLRNELSKDMYKVDVEYFTPRGRWYNYSWKGDVTKSGGVITNIGIHLFDLLIWLFGEPKHYRVDILSNMRASGVVVLEHAIVNWKLSINPEDSHISYRSIKIDDEEIEFSDKFIDLHTKSYEKILDGDGFGTDDVSSAIELVYSLRKCGNLVRC